ncbi:DUF2242 domain-containing protein [Pararobbsia silviterrae]|uniref:DUF2242 domain-containing protein n=1 Tax=Pararobbsia silviterrae TaxID=1792498 RepID=A0A494XRT4_9BURK|nr:DUF2242 domain-containing protein [Pararobbsia silviterrae]RKP53348.1 DUF2242 domain-containing protein [Pararobbsia silviterrae]
MQIKSGMSSLAWVALSWGVLTALAGCSTPKPLYQSEQFDSKASPFARNFNVGAAATCQAARRALLSQGYMTTSTRFDLIDGSKNFQPDADSHVTIEFHVVCTSDDPDSPNSTAYVSAVQDRYTLKKTSTSASVGLSVLGSVSLPIGSSDDSMVKIASETIPAGVFYDRFFNLVKYYIDTAPEKPAPVKPVTPPPPMPDPVKPPHAAEGSAHAAHDTTSQATPSPAAGAGPSSQSVVQPVASAQAATVPAAAPTAVATSTPTSTPTSIAPQEAAAPSAATSVAVAAKPAQAANVAPASPSGTSSTSGTSTASGASGTSSTSGTSGASGASSTSNTSSAAVAVAAPTAPTASPVTEPVTTSNTSPAATPAASPAPAPSTSPSATPATETAPAPASTVENGAAATASPASNVVTAEADATSPASPAK